MQKLIETQTEEKMLDVKTVACRLGISTSLVYEWLKEDPPRIRRKRYGQKGRRGVYRVPESALNEFIASREGE